MLKLLGVEISLHNVPGWVWAWLLGAVFFFGILHMVPEAKQALGRVFATTTPTPPKVTPAPKELPKTMEEEEPPVAATNRCFLREGRRVCVPYFPEDDELLRRGPPDNAKIYPTKREADAKCGKSNVVNWWSNDGRAPGYACLTAK